VGDVGAELAARALYPLGQLVPVRADQPVTLERRRARQPGVAACDEAFDGVMITPRQLGRATIRAGQIVGFQNLHDLLDRLHPVPPVLRRVVTRSEPAETPKPGKQDEPEHDGEISRPPVGNSGGRPWGLSWPSIGTFSWPPTINDHIAARIAEDVYSTLTSHPPTPPVLRRPFTTPCAGSVTGTLPRRLGGPHTFMSARSRISPGHTPVTSRRTDLTEAE
jgi:hypothetical protein